MGMLFSTKAKTLENLSNKLNQAQVPSLYYFTVKEWRDKQNECLSHIYELDLEPYKTMCYAVRSSAITEDTIEQSCAGAYCSCLNVSKDGLIDAIEQVIASYGVDDEQNQILIQPMLSHVIYSGVAFSHDPNTKAPYTVINWIRGHDTSVITSAAQNGFVYQHTINTQKVAPSYLQPIIKLTDELFHLFDRPVDIEFAVTQYDNKEQLWLLQARPLAGLSKSSCISNQKHHDLLQQVHNKISLGVKKHPFLDGSSTVYGVMPDWNPAEIIGIRPKPLSLSLYRELITDSIWAYQRHNYGYRNLRGFPLLHDFCGLPYIDVRCSFNSFIPADLDHTVASKLVEYYISKLTSQRSLHDKIEFDIVISCYSFDLESKFNELLEYGFKPEEIEQIRCSVKKLTNNVLNKQTGIWRLDIDKLKILQKRHEDISNASLSSIEQIYWLLEDCKRYGTLPFAGLARAGFIAVQLLQSLVHVGILSQEHYTQFISSLTTIGKELTIDKTQLNKTDFLKKYGHLRPGTYDITTPRYDEAPDLYFDWPVSPSSSHRTDEKDFSLNLQQMIQLDNLLKSHAIETDTIGLLEFLKLAIEGRELAKFYFTKNLSDALQLIKKIGAEYGYSVADLSYSNIMIFKELFISSHAPKALIERSIAQGKEQYELTCALSLPPIISHPNDILSFEWPELSANYITQKIVTAPIITLSQSKDKASLNGALICIPNADPGFDWLLSHNIAGIITTWGGVNSHMAIRAGELGLPSLIGAGEPLYQKLSHAQMIHLDCPGRKVEVIK